MSTWQTVGKVRMTPRGVYDSTVAYEILDLVSNSDETTFYIAKQAVPAGTALTNTSYWVVMADVSEAVENAEDILSYIADAYSTSSAYSVGDYVIHDGTLYKCIVAIPSGENWNSAHWTEASLTGDMSDFGDTVNNVVLVQDAEPTNPKNKIWLMETTPEGVQIPTYSEFQTGISAKVNINQGSNNSGKAMVVGSDGNLSPQTIDTGVTSVAGKTGAVTLDGDDVGYSDNYTYDSGTIGSAISSLKTQVSDINTATSGAIGKALSPKTVSGGKVTEWQFKSIEGGGGSADLFYVTPEEYGAVGDGVTDDSQAVQDACDAGYAVYFASGKTYYLASAVTIDHDCHLFGGENATIKTKTPDGGTAPNGIVVNGTLKKTTTLTTDYSSTGSTDNSGNQFTLSDMTGIAIGDILIVEATDQYYSYARGYYYLGGVLLVSDIYDGHVYTSNSMPWNITNTANVTVKIYSAPTAIIENLNFVSDLDSRGNYEFLLTLNKCKDSSIRNCNLTQMDNGVFVSYCVNTMIDGVTVSKSKYDNTLTGDGYGIMIFSCSETIIQRVLAICAQGCVDLGGQIPNINTYIRNCNLASECRAVGVDMHENSYNIVVEDCTLGGLSLYGTAQVNRCRLIKSNRFGNTGHVGIIYRGTHNPDWATLHVENCIFDGNDIGISLQRPIPQTPVQAFDNIIGNVEIFNCVNGVLNFMPDTSASVLSNTIKRLMLDNWANCNKFYHTSGNVVEYMQVNDCTFKNIYWASDNNASHGVYLDGIRYLDYKATYPNSHKISVNQNTRGNNIVLPAGVSIQLASSNENAKFRICGANLTPNNADDYLVGSVNGNTGAALIRNIATGTHPTVTIDNNGDPVFTLVTTSNRAFYPVGLFAVPENGNVYISATLKNTGDTTGVKIYPYIAIVNGTTGLVRKRQNGTAVTSTADGAAASHSESVYAGEYVLPYWYCETQTLNAVTTFEDMSIQFIPKFAPPVVNEDYQSVRRTGDGVLTSLAGVNNIMCSENTFTVKFSADLVNNPIWPVPTT